MLKLNRGGSMKCKNCGATITEQTKFCPNCGTPIENVENNETPKKIEVNNGKANAQNVTTTEVKTETNTISSDDTKVIRILSYFGILFLIGMFCSQKNDPNVRFHVGQGMILCICNVAVYIIISLISPLMFFMVGLGSLLRMAVGILILILEIIGIINAAKNENKPLPVIGSFAFYK